MKTEKVNLTEREIQLIVSALEEKINRLGGLNLQDKSRIENLKKITSFLESHI